MSHERRLDYLHSKQIIYRRLPITDEPTVSFDWGWYYEEGTRECYDLFRSSAKINTYKSLKWHLLVLWYLNPTLSSLKFESLVKFICNNKNGFTTFTVPIYLMDKIMQEVNAYDLDKPPSNKIRKVIFNYNCKLSLSEKLSIVGQIIGRSKKITDSDIYEMMLYINDAGKKITISDLAKNLSCTTRTVYRNMTNELKQEKEFLNQRYEEIQHRKLHSV